jgi:hypothetical protein
MGKPLNHLWAKNLKTLAEIMKLQQAPIYRMVECNPVMKRSLKCKREIEATSHPHLEIIIYRILSSFSYILPFHSLCLVMP